MVLDAHHQMKGSMRRMQLLKDSDGEWIGRL